MNRLIKSISLVIIIFSIITCNSVTHPVKHVLLITIDGAHPEYYMDPSWPAPILQKLKHKGVYAPDGIKSVFPSVTRPSHTSISTGAYPSTHGIYFNAPFEGGSTDYLYHKAIKSETLWEAVKKAGMTSGSVYWPGTAGAPIDYNFPVMLPEKNEQKDQLSLTQAYISPNNLLSNIEKDIGKKITTEDLSHVNFAHSKTVAEISNYIIEKYKPNLMAIHFLDTDHYQHNFGTDSPEVRNIVQLTDSLIGTVLKTIKKAGIEKSTAVIIVGDHGHINTKATFAPNVYLNEHGLIKDKDWKAKFNGAFLYLKDKNDSITLKSVISILKNSPEYQRGDFRLLDRNELDKMGANTETSIAIAMKEGIALSNKIDGNAFVLYKGKPKSGHGYDPAYRSMHTAFMAFGPGIQKDKTVSGIELIDIAPLVSHLLKLDFKAPDGKLFPGIINE